MSTESEFAGWSHEDLIAEVEKLHGMLKVSRRDTRELRKYLTVLATTTQRAIAALDAEMLKPHSNERGKRIAEVTNALEMQNDMAMRFGLGKIKRRTP